MTVPAAFAWPTNAHLVEAVASLGYLRREWSTLDPTYGMGVFWRRWKPDHLTAGDLDPRKSPIGYSLDCTDLRTRVGLTWPSEVFDAVVLDGPYKLNGTSAEKGDERFGVHLPATWQGRHRVIRDGITEGERVLKPKGILLVKCQDQVCSGQKRWQVIEFATHAASLGLRLIDRFDMLGTSRPQPAQTRKDGKPSVQQHAHGHPSTLLVFRKPA